MGWFGDGLSLARLIFGLPLILRHAVNMFARLRPAELQPLRFGGIFIPVGQAVPAKARQIHKVKVLHIRALTQVFHQPAERGSFKLSLGFGIGLHLV